ncbi:MAG TPA: GerAB/ArcD/ProY family transporter [Methylomusa anaerophila]|uniref:Spore germination protein n=1 Tax=Methylomusa anaerophila TaxID=1930071 RepID=A0A348AK87_9FIRM|nr:GerAB/ArcD/ProY family transporter [Methylomusa anaerophila]BBB91485.1 spore germination protein [Methylomusa anaerophila]HML89926.1 GerAB/ArcD/ProY family transporter [Methylomusa anaerophila]
MRENIQLTREQTFFLLIIGTIGNMVYSHTWIDNDTDRAAWLAAFAGILLLIPFAAWILYLGKHQPGGTVFDILEAGLGKISCVLVGVPYILINIAVAVAMLNMFTELIKAFFLIFTPHWIVMLVLLLLPVILLSNGFQALARTVELLSVLGLLNYFFSFAFAFPKYIHMEYVIPVFDTSLLGFVKGALFMTGTASECLLLLMIIVGYIPTPGKRYLWIVTGLAACAVIFSSAILAIMAIMSPELAKRIAFGGLNAAKLIQVGEFIRGLEVFIFGTYQFIAIGKTTLCLYCAWTLAKKMFNNWKPKFLLAVTALMIFAPAVWLNSYNKGYELAVILGYVVLPFSIFVLLLASVSVLLKKKSAKRTGCTAK